MFTRVRRAELEALVASRPFPLFARKFTDETVVVADAVADADGLFGEWPRRGRGSAVAASVGWRDVSRSVAGVPTRLVDALAALGVFDST